MVKTCQNCPDRVVKVEDGKVITCKSTCKDYKVRKLENLHIKNKKIKHNQIIGAAIEQILKNKGKRLR